MSSEFKVGDRVRIFNDRFGAVTYGPVLSTFGTKTHYAVADEETGAERLYDRVDLALAPKFAVGDKVRKDGWIAEILAGPVIGSNTGEDIYLYTYVDGPNAGTGGGQAVSKFEALTVTEPALITVGTRVRVDRAKYARSNHGKTGVIRSNTETWTPRDDVTHVYDVELDDGGSIYAAEVTPSTGRPTASSTKASRTGTACRTPTATVTPGRSSGPPEQAPFRSRTVARTASARAWRTS